MDTRRARVSSNEHDKRRKQGKMQANPRVRAARGEGDVGGQERHIGAPHRAQNDAMPMTRIEPYRPPRPTVRELMEGRSEGADDGGIPLKRYLGRPLKLAYRTEDRVEPERRVRGREIQLVRGGATESTHSRRAAVRGRARDRRRGKGGVGERREGREESDTREGQPTGLAGDRQGHVPRGREDRRRTPRGAVTR